MQLIILTRDKVYYDWTVIVYAKKTNKPLLYKS